MIKKLLISLVLLSFTAALQATTARRGWGNSKQRVNVLTNEAIVQAMGVDSLGNSASGMTVRFPPGYTGPGGAVTLGIAWPTNITTTAYTQTSATATSILVSFTAGVTCPCMIGVGSTSGSGPFLHFKSNSSTPPANWDGITAPTWGNDIAVDAGIKYFAVSNGDWFHTIAVDTGDTIITREIDQVTRQ